MGSICLEGTLSGLVQRLYPSDCRIPYAFTAEWTRRCNFACEHCYCRLPAEAPPPQEELTTEDWRRLLSESVEAGALFALITGGEPLLREDFRLLWQHTREVGLIPVLFTNGSLLDADTADFLAHFTPRNVSITLYGATAETYGHMTGHPEMHARALRALDLLRERGVPVAVRSLITRRNKHEFEAMRQQSARYQATFTWDAELLGSFSEGGGCPQELRLSPTELVELEWTDETRRAEWQRLAAQWRPAAPSPQTPFRCRTGEGEFHLTPYGKLQPCIGLEQVSLDLREMSIQNAWQHLPEAVAALVGEPGPCQSCGLPPICRQCPADALLEGVPAGWPLPWRCELARQRARALGLPEPPTTT